MIRSRGYRIKSYTELHSEDRQTDYRACYIQTELQTDRHSKVFITSNKPVTQSVAHVDS